MSDTSNPLYNNRPTGRISIRLQHWDYSNNGAYFITICTLHRAHFFGEIQNGKMELSRQGVIADLLWHEIKHHTKNVTLGEFVVMPNHIHDILILDDGHDGVFRDDVPHDDVPRRDVACNVPTKNEQMAALSPKAHTVSVIIRSYKSAVTKHCNRLGFTFAWQTRFYDHIIRNEAAFQQIATYINNNPANWKEDKFY